MRQVFRVFNCFSIVANKLKGAGVETHHEKAMEWYKKAADQGHVHSAYNLGVGHLKGMRTPIDRTYVLQIVYIQLYFKELFMY